MDFNAPGMFCQKKFVIVSNWLKYRRRRNFKLHFFQEMEKTENEWLVSGDRVRRESSQATKRSTWWSSSLEVRESSQKEQNNLSISQ